MSSGVEDGPFDILGSKVLLGVQVVDLSRLSTHPIPMVGQGLVTVAGQGPTDSNGAGKSSWIAALSLLHADDQWRLTSGAPGAAELLFTAEAAVRKAISAPELRPKILDAPVSLTSACRSSTSRSIP